MLLLFNQCKLLSSLDGLENWETKNVLYMRGMFFYIYDKSYYFIRTAKYQIYKDC